MMTPDETSEWIGLPEWAKDAVYSDIDVHLGFWDAVKLLWFRQFNITVKTSTEVRQARIESTSRVRIPRLRWPWEKRMQLGVAEAPREPVS